ncbi:MAG: Stp1/IreP family PP2C-type Ser/Thr phosphatase [Acidobacteria bacterium]|nr:MAG: Stp1/IreP family PP2C-type Ser/Thr phosphatase [Acidobacteriota bacterium]
MTLRAAGRTDRGRVRPHNEDSLLVDPKRAVAAVADGMGGHAAGEVASRLAVEALDETLTEAPRDADAVPELLRRAVAEANRRIAETIREHPEYHGMGTTLVAAVWAGDRLFVAHVGDSRAYLIRDGRIRQLTTDHSFVNELVRLGMISREQAARDPRRNVVTRALGSGPVVVPDVIEERILPGDTILLCSDGLSSMLDDARILETVRRAQGDLERGCADLIAAANEAGGEDNVTVVLASPAPQAPPPADAAETGPITEGA